MLNINDEKGFSLAEMLVAVGMFSILTSIGLIQFSKANENYKLISDTESLEAFISFHRSEAIRFRRSVEFGFVHSAGEPSKVTINNDSDADKEAALPFHKGVELEVQKELGDGTFQTLTSSGFEISALGFLNDEDDKSRIRFKLRNGIGERAFILRYTGVIEKE